MKNLFIFFVILLYSTKIYCDRSLNFLSTQLNPVYEMDSMKQIILKDFDEDVNFIPLKNREIKYYLNSKDISFDLLGGTYGEFKNLKDENLILNVNNIIPEINSTVISNFNKISKLGTKDHYFIPWMQATYIMVANKKALKYLPKNSDINNLKYEELIKWSENLLKKTGSKKIGFPIGKNGLWHRFLEGYLYPSYTGDMISKINSKESYKMWLDMKKLWKYTKISSLTYNKMDIPLLNEEVWIAWDHTARLNKVFRQNPNDFIAFPTPIGPKGRGYMLVLAGLGIPNNSSQISKVSKLISYLLSDKIQILMTNSVGFFPVIEISDIKNLKLKKMYNAIVMQEKNKNSIPVMLPTNLGKKSSEVDSIYKIMFSKIVLRNKDIEVITKFYENKINDLLNK